MDDDGQFADDPDESDIVDTDGHGTFTDEDEASATERWLEFEAGLDELDADPDDEPEFDVLGGDEPEIPVKHSGVKLQQLHPELHHRLRRALADARLSKVARVSSGVRTYAQQKALYAKYGRGRAANPDYRGRDGRRGSKHMVQSSDWRYAEKFAPGDYGYAIDVGFWKSPTTAEWRFLRSVMGEYGLRLTVFRPFEPWHFELDPAVDPTTTSATADTTHDQKEHPDMQLVTDPETGRQWATWSGPGGVQHVREYGTPRAGAGTDMPGISVIIDEQVAKGAIIDART